MTDYSAADTGPEPRPAPARLRGWLIAGALLLVWIVYLAFFGPRPGREGLLPPPELSEERLGRLEGGWKLEDLDGRPLDLSELRGKAVFLNRWATWCPPCVAELPAIARLASNSRLKGKPIAFVLVSDEPRETIRRFAASERLSLPLYHGVGPAPDAVETQAIPATFLIAPDGEIVSRQIGSAQWDDPGVVLFLERLASRPAGSEPTPAVTP